MTKYIQSLQINSITTTSSLATQSTPSNSSSTTTISNNNLIQTDNRSIEGSGNFSSSNLNFSNAKKENEEKLISPKKPSKQIFEKKSTRTNVKTTSKLPFEIKEPVANPKEANNEKSKSDFITKLSAVQE